MQKVLITGASGFIGRYLCEKIDSKRLVIRGSTKSMGGDTFRVDNIDEKTNWTGAFRGVETVVHMAGVAHSKKKLDAEYDRVNLLGTENLANAAVAAGVKRFIYISSIGVIGNSSNTTPFKPDTLCSPINSYTKSKLNAEHSLKRIEKNSSLQVLIIRPPLVYALDAPGNFKRLLNLVLKMRALPFGSITNSRDFISVLNLVDLISVCINHPEAHGKIFLPSDGKPVSTKELTNLIAKVYGRKVYQFPIPNFILKYIFKILGKGNIYEQLCLNLEVDSSNIYNTLGWTPPFSMEQSMVIRRNLND